LTIPFDADWRRVIVSPGATAALARWANLEPGLAGGDLDSLRRRAASRDAAQSDTTLAALLRLAQSDGLARRTILEALLPRLVPIAAALARRNGEEFDDVLVEVAGWAWGLAATTPADRWTELLAPKLARLAKRRYLAARPYRPDVFLGDTDLAAASDRVDEQLGSCEVTALLARAIASGTITAAAARVLRSLAVADATDRVIARQIGRTETATKKTRERALARLRTYRWALALCPMIRSTSRRDTALATHSPGRNPR
jgi:hypothetical protein